MKLRFAPPSPFARAAVVTAHEAGLMDRIKLVPTDPWSPETDLGKDNPAAKIPTLILPDGMVIGESWAICEYFEHLNRGPSLVPSGVDYAADIRVRALGYGIMEASVARRIETFVRPEAYRWDGWVARQTAKFNGILDALETAADGFGTQVTLGQISVGCALGYMDFRYDDEQWRAARPALADWYETFSQRPSMIATQI